MPKGLAILKRPISASNARCIDAETTPLRDPEHYQYDLNLPDIAEVWRRGSVIASWLLDLTATALVQDPALAEFAGRVSDSGEGRWTIKAAIDEGVPAHVLSAALYERFSSRGEADFADKLLSAMRYEFGGHIEKRGGEPVIDGNADCRNEKRVASTDDQSSISSRSTRSARSRSTRSSRRSRVIPARRWRSRRWSTPARSARALATACCHRRCRDASPSSKARYSAGTVMSVQRARSSV